MLEDLLRLHVNFPRSLFEQCLDGCWFKDFFVPLFLTPVLWRARFVSFAEVADTRENCAPAGSQHGFPSVSRSDIFLLVPPALRFFFFRRVSYHVPVTPLDRSGRRFLGAKLFCEWC